MTFSRPPRKALRSSALKRSGPIKPKRRTAKEKAAKFDREYGGAERVEWIASLPCIVSGRIGGNENVHVKGDGMSRKAGYRWIVPMRGELHRELHRIGVASFEAKYDVDLLAYAESVASVWDRRAAEVSTCDPDFWPEVIE